MNQRVVTGLLTAGCIALAGAGYMTYKNQDRTAPEIKVDRVKRLPIQKVKITESFWKA